MDIILPVTLDAEVELVAPDLDDIVAGDYVELRIRVRGLLQGDTLPQMALTAKRAVADTDDALTTVQRVLHREDEGAEGIFRVPLSPRERLCVVRLAPAETAKLREAKTYDLRFWLVRDGKAVFRTTKPGTITAIANAVTGLTKLTFAGTATIEAPPLDVRGEGTQRFKGTAAIAPTIEIAGSGTQRFHGSGAIQAPAILVAGAGDNGILFEWRIGQSPTAAGLAFGTLAAGRTYRSAVGALVTVGSGVVRDQHTAYNPTTLAWEPVLLVEGGGANELPYSETITGWSTSNVTRLAAAAAAPDGTVTAVRTTDDAVNAGHNFRRSVAAFVDNMDVAASVFAAPETRGRMSVRVTDRTGAIRRVVFNLTTGAVVSQTAGIVRILSDAWTGAYRRLGIVVNVGAGAAAPVVSYELAADDGTVTYSGLGESVLTWGMQAHAGTYWRSYVRTEAAAASVAAESCTVPAVSGGGTLIMYRRYFDLATRTFVDNTVAYASGVAQAIGVDRGYTHLAVIRGNKTTAQCRALLGIA